MLIVRISPRCGETPKKHPSLVSLQGEGISLLRRIQVGVFTHLPLRPFSDGTQKVRLVQTPLVLWKAHTPQNVLRGRVGHASLLREARISRLPQVLHPWW
jgi:hypothetical protein